MNTLSHWNLKEPPFESVCGGGFFFESEGHAEALSRLLFMVSDSETDMGALSGDIGSGKTLLLRVMASKLDAARYRTVYMSASFSSIEKILSDLLRELQGAARPVAAEADKYELLKNLEQMLHYKIAVTGRQLLVVLDDVHALNDECLDELKCLSHFNHREPLLTLLLCGRTELKSKMDTVFHTYQKPEMLCHLKYLRYGELLPYLRCRLTVAGAEDPDLFLPECVDLLSSFTGGSPRQLNRIGKLALDLACRNDQRKIGREIIHSIIDDIENHFA